jgi:hypothetical protein
MKWAPLLVLFASSAFAQAWATEPAGLTPDAGAPTAPSDSSAAHPPPAAPALDYKPVLPEVKWSAGKGAFGIRVGFGTNASLSTQGGTATSPASLVAPSVGIAYFFTDSVKLLVDVGAGFSFDRNVAFAVNAGLGIDILFRTPADALRPLISVGGSFGLASVGTRGVSIGFGAHVGGGAEYFFNPSFSVSGKLLIDVPMGIGSTGSFALAVSTFSPTIGGTWYF